MKSSSDTDPPKEPGVTNSTLSFQTLGLNQDRLLQDEGLTNRDHLPN